MRSKYFFLIYSSVIISSAIFNVESAPASQSNSKDIGAITAGNKALASPTSQVTTKKPKRSPKANTIRQSEEGENEVEVIEGDAGAGDGDGEPPSVLPPKPKDLPRFPSFNKPFAEFQADLDKIFEHINAGLEKVVEGFHDLVHDPGVSHDKMFITAYDPDMFKNMIAKYDEQQAARRRFLQEQEVQAKAARIASRLKPTTTAKSTIV